MEITYLPTKADDMRFDFLDLEIPPNKSNVSKNNGPEKDDLKHKYLKFISLSITFDKIHIY